MANYADSVINSVVEKNPNEIEFIQAVKEVLETLDPVLSSINTKKRFIEHKTHQNVRYFRRGVKILHAFHHEPNIFSFF